jgi:hypothetical protein
MMAATQSIAPKARAAEVSKVSLCVPALAAALRHVDLCGEDLKTRCLVVAF